MSEYYAGSLSSGDILSLAPRGCVYSTSLGITREYGLYIKAIGRYSMPKFGSIFEIVILFGSCFGRMMMIPTSIL